MRAGKLRSWVRRRFAAKIAVPLAIFGIGRSPILPNFVRVASQAAFGGLRGDTDDGEWVQPAVTLTRSASKVS